LAQFLLVMRVRPDALQLCRGWDILAGIGLTA